MGLERPGILSLGWRSGARLENLFLVIFLIDLALGSCVPNPVPLRVGDVTLSNQQTARGIEVSIGNPAQTMAIIPQWPLNNTLLFGTNGYCLSSKWTAAACTTNRGGAYDQVASKSRTVPDTTSYPVDGSPYVKMSFVADSLTFKKGPTLENFPMGIALNDFGQQGYVTKAGLGLGTNSSILNTLKSTGNIASRSWSFFWGRDSPNTTNLDGSFIFGGYDRAKTVGQRYNFNISPWSSTCSTGLLVSATDLILNFSNGTSASIFPKSRSDAMSICINPQLSVSARIPLDPYFNNWMTYTDNEILNMDRSFGYYFYNMRYPPGTPPYTGDLSIVLMSGPTIRIPNDQLVMPHQEIDGATGKMIVNNTGPDLVVDSLQEINANDPAQLGFQFLTAAYLLVNYDTNQFSLWEANPTSSEDIVGLDENGKETTTFCSESVSNATNITVAEPPDTTQSQSLPAGTIAGAVVGAVAGCAGLAILCFLVWRRRKQHKAAEEQLNVAQAQYHLANSEDINKTTGWIPPQELPNNHVEPARPSELSG